MTNNWKDIHPEFGSSRLLGEYFQWQWQTNGFDYQQTQAWINADLRPWEHEIAWWLVSIERQDPHQLTRENIKVLKKEYAAVEETIPWLKKGFTEEEIDRWTSKGLNIEQADLANYLKTNKLSFSEEFGQKYYQAQTWLDLNYPQAVRSQVQELVLVNLNLQGSLNLVGFPNLEEIYCTDNKLTSLAFTNCPKLKIILCSRNRLTNLTLVDCPNITKLVANKNQLTNLDFMFDLSNEKLEMLNISSNNIIQSSLTPFANFTNLCHLGLGNWYKEIIERGVSNHFHGSLVPLQNLTNLEELDLAGTDIDSGWETLPASIQTLYLFSKESPDSQVNLIAEQLRQYGETAKDRHEDEDFAPLLIKLKDKKRIQFLEEERIIFSNQKLEIDYLQTRINELINLNKEKTERIFNALSHLLPEKDLLGRLVKTHLELIKYKNQSLKDSNYSKQKKKDERQILSLKDQLEEKLTEEQMNNVESILDDFEKLINQELEIENKLIQKQSLIENHKQTSLMIDNSEIWKIVSLEEVVQNQQIQSLRRTNSVIQEIAFWQGQAIAYKEIALNSSQSFIDELLADSELLQQSPEVLQKINHLLGIKRSFLQARESTITKLQATCDLLEYANIGKYARIEEASKALSASGKLVANWLPLNIIEPVGDGATVFNARKKRKFAIKNSQAFQQLLTEEEKNSELFKESYKKLLAFLPRMDKEEEPSLFSRCYQIYQVATNLWKDKKHLDTSDMKDAIAALQTNYLDLQTELKAQETSLAQLNTSQDQALVVVPTT